MSLRLTRLLTVLALVSVGGIQVILSRLTPGLATPHEDEGLYLFTGHQMISHLSHGSPLSESPASYFSGAPQLYPVVAALVDSVFGLQGARDLSLVFAVLCMAGVYLLGHELFGRGAGLVGALAFAVSGSVVYLSQWATFDAMMLSAVAWGSWLAVRGARRAPFLWMPVAAVVLALATVIKYAGLAYIPVVAALAAGIAWRRDDWRGAMWAIAIIPLSAALALALALHLDREMLNGFVQTTLHRAVLNPGSPTAILQSTAIWVGPWVFLGALGAVTQRRRPLGLGLLLLGAAVLAPAQQARIGEMTSLPKHVAFGLVFAAPVLGELLSRLGRTAGWAVVSVTALALTLHGLHFGALFRTSYADETQLHRTLGTLLSAHSNGPVLGDRSTVAEYAFRGRANAPRWDNTYFVSYQGRTGLAGYEQAIQDGFYQVIYLDAQSSTSQHLSKLLTDPTTGGDGYRLVAEIPRIVRESPAGEWRVWVRDGVT